MLTPQHRWRSMRFGQAKKGRRPKEKERRAEGKRFEWHQRTFAARPMHMVDAQGERIQSAGNRRLRLIATAKDGSNVEFVEQFALGQGVTHPLLSLGRL